MAEVTRPQDLPPPGGYSKILYERTPAKKFFNGYRIFGVYVVSMSVGFWGALKAAKHLRIIQAEARSGQNAIEPFLTAERDRLYLNQLRKNREYETDLMKNVKSWEVGTLFGAPIYSTVDADDYFEPLVETYYVHSSPEDAKRRMNLKFWL